MLSSIPRRSSPMTGLGQRTQKNDLLAALPAHVRRGVENLAQRVVLKTGDLVNEPGGRLRFALFPAKGVISVVSLLREGRSMEVATIGCEGMSGASALLGVDLVPYRYVVQIPGDALRIRIHDLLELAGHGSPLSSRIFRYYVAFTSQVMQSVACAGLHSVEQRCCRWLLATHDRVDSDRFPLSRGPEAHVMHVLSSRV